VDNALDSINQNEWQTDPRVYFANKLFSFFFVNENVKSSALCREYWMMTFRNKITNEQNYIRKIESGRNNFIYTKIQSHYYNINIHL